MRKLILLFILLWGVAVSAQTQVTKREAKTIKKADKYYSKKEYDKAIEVLGPVVKAHTNNAELWDKLIAYYVDKYDSYGSGNMIYITVSGKGGKDNLAKNLSLRRLNL